MKSYTNFEAHIRESSEVKMKTLNKMEKICKSIVSELSTTLKRGNKILIFGNGGSAADSQHISAEFMSVLEKKNHDRGPLSAISLATDIAFITAHANDFHFDNIFTRQIAGLAKKGDVLLGISTSGNSKNVNNGMKLGQKLGLSRISFTGLSGKNLIDNSDIPFVVQSKNTQIIQETYICFAHIIIAEVEKELDLNCTKQ